MPYLLFLVPFPDLRNVKVRINNHFQTHNIIRRHLFVAACCACLTHSILQLLLSETHL